MSNRFDEAPPLPRQPTAISVPEAMASEQSTQDQPLPTDSLPPPPKFPSLTDVGLSSATAAAATMEPSDATNLSSIPEQSSPAPPDSQPDLPAEQAVETSTTTTTTTTTTTYITTESVQVSNALPADIEAAIARDSVAPGTGVKKAIEAGQRLWTDGDQEQLNRLLKEGQQALVPPDVSEEDLMKVRNSYFTTVPLPEGESSTVDQAEDETQRGLVASRVAAWHQVVSKDDDRKDRGVVGGVVPVPLPTGVPSDTVENVTGRSLDHKPDEVDEGLDAVPVEDTPEDDEHDQAEGEKEETKDADAEGAAVSRSAELEKDETDPSKADVSKSIFGGHFLSVPVLTRKQREQSAVGTIDDAPGRMEEVTTEVMLKSDAAARINVTEDYGLEGGHAEGTNDAAFLNDGSLVTCGNDGKVCIWDMQERVVESEFVPYNGEAVTMVYPLQNDDQANTKIIVTLSKSRLMRIWTVDKKSAIMLRSTQIKSSEKELYMSIPHISSDLRARATAAAYAAAITTTDPPKIPTSLSPKKEDPTAAATQADTTVTAEATTESAAADNENEEVDDEENKDSKRFSFKKVLSFGRKNSSSRKAVAS